MTTYQAPDIFDPTDTVVRFITSGEIASRYHDARIKFYRHRNLYIICRAHCHLGGYWPNLTRKNKDKMNRAAIKCREYQRAKNSLERMRQNVWIADYCNG